MRYRACPALALLAFATSVSAQVAVVNSASFIPRQPVAPGSLASAFGPFTGITATSASALPLPRTLAGVRVLIDGNIEAPLLYVANEVINFHVPVALGAGTHQIRVVTGSGEHNGSFSVIETAAGLYAMAGTGEPLRAHANNQNGSINGPDNPEARDRVVTLWATGQGPTSQQVADGAAAPLTPLITAMTTPVAYVGGVEAQVDFSGLAPTFASVFIVNVRIPNLPFLSGRVPVQVFMNGIQSNEVSIFVAQ